MTHIHLIGIGGSGLSAIARVLLEMGYTVSGSDRVESPFTRDLQAAGVNISIGHDPKNVRGANLVVRSSAIQNDNPEVIAARAHRILVLKRADFLGSLMDGRTGIAVAGTHGKTTTTAMIAWVLSSLGQDPTFIIGGVAENLGANAHAGKGTPFVIEADEYDRMFLGLKPDIEVVTNIEYDHPDCYPTSEDYQAAFTEFMYHLASGGTLVACMDDPETRDLMGKARKLGRKVISYGLHKEALKGQIVDVYADVLESSEKGGFSFKASVMGNSAVVKLLVPGVHNVSNALAALAVTRLLDLSTTDAAGVLSQFVGTRRRFELRGEANGIVVIDDYAHHPTEIRSTLAAARARYPRSRIWAVWQPHTYSRTQALFSEFANAFAEADEVVVTEIYPSREPKQDYSSKKVVEAMPRPAKFIPELNEASNYLIKNLRPGDTVLVFSAGDADQVSTAVVTHFKEAGNE
jgi:UDP-N-acetylmuramate--alanine ligase